MIQYTIQFELYPEKLDEFNLSWESFCLNTRETEGLSECTMKEKKANNYEIVMIWSEQFYLNLFMKEQWYNFLRGAINVLGEESIIIQKQVLPE